MLEFFVVRYKNKTQYTYPNSWLSDIKNKTQYTLEFPPMCTSDLFPSDSSDKDSVVKRDHFFLGCSPFLDRLFLGSSPLSL